MSERIVVHFQELVFEGPKDRFVVAAFDPGSGAFEWGREYAVPTTTVQLAANDAPVPGLLQALGNTPYAIATARVPDRVFSYRTYLLNVAERRVVQDLGGGGSGGLDGRRFLFTAAGELKAIDLATRVMSIVDKEVDAVAVGPLVLTFGAGRVVDMATGKLLGSYRGIVTRAGFLSDNWVWYFARRNEKSTGKLYLLNVAKGKATEVKTNLRHGRVVLVEPPGVSHEFNESGTALRQAPR